jgi:exonuclease VII small subunit
MSKRKSFLEKLDALTDALGRSDGQSLEEIKEELESEGIDLNASIKHLMEAVHKSSKASRRQSLDQAREERLKRDVSGSTYFNKFADWSREQLLERLNEIISDRSVATSASFRDLESRSDKDLASLLEDLEQTKDFSNEEPSDEH